MAYNTWRTVRTADPALVDQQAQFARPSLREYSATPAILIRPDVMIEPGYEWLGIDVEM